MAKVIEDLDLNRMLLAPNEIVLSRALRRLAWANTEIMRGYNVYRNTNRDIIGVTYYLPDHTCKMYVIEEGLQ